MLTKTHTISGLKKQIASFATGLMWITTTEGGVEALLKCEFFASEEGSCYVFPQISFVPKGTGERIPFGSGSTES